MTGQPKQNEEMDLSGIRLPSNRKFGFFFTAVLALLGAYSLNEASTSVATISLASAVILFLVTIFHADVLQPLNELWMKLGLLLGMIISPIVLGIIFFALFTPVSLLMKLFGRDELRLELSDRASHWKQRSSDKTNTDTFKHQF